MKITRLDINGKTREAYSLKEICDDMGMAHRSAKYVEQKLGIKPLFKRAGYGSGVPTFYDADEYMMAKAKLPGPTRSVEAPDVALILDQLRVLNRKAEGLQSLMSNADHRICELANTTSSALSAIRANTEMIIDELSRRPEPNPSAAGIDAAK